MGGPPHRDVKKMLGFLPEKRLKLAGWESSESIGHDKPGIALPKSIKNSMLYGSNKFKKKVLNSLQKNFLDGLPSRPPLFHINPVGTSDTLVKDTKLLTQWQASARQLSHVEMEAGGVYHAARNAGSREYPFLCIRGISDIVGFKRDNVWTQYACHTAAAFAQKLISCDILKTLSPQCTKNDNNVSVIEAKTLSKPPVIAKSTVRKRLEYLMPNTLRKISDLLKENHQIKTDLETLYVDHIIEGCDLIDVFLENKPFDLLVVYDG